MVLKRVEEGVVAADLRRRTQSMTAQDRLLTSAATDGRRLVLHQDACHHQFLQGRRRRPGAAAAWVVAERFSA
jgi:hypothetical protein